MATITYTQVTQIVHHVTLRTLRMGTGPDVKYYFDEQQDQEWELASFSDGVDLEKFTYRFLRDGRVHKVWLVELPKGLLDYPTQVLSKELLKEYSNRGEVVFEEWECLFGGRVLNLSETPMEFHVNEMPLLDRDRIYFKVFPTTGEVVTLWSMKKHKRFISSRARTDA